MTLNEKIKKMSELKKELSQLKKSFTNEMLEITTQEFRNRGFVNDPRGPMYEGSFYDPKTKVSVRIGNIGSSSIAITVIDMVDDGMTWGSAYTKIFCEIRFYFLKEDFETFFNTTFKNHVKRLEEILAK